MTSPTVSCVMPTFGRPDYVAESIQMFLEQDYPHKELLVFNDCPGQVLKGEFPNTRIVNLNNRFATLGEKRNAAIEMSSGQFIAVWDDDDVYLPWRLSYCMARIQELETELYCPAEYWAYWGDDILHDNQAVLDWIYHPQVIFHKDLWRKVGGYPLKTLYEDTGFFKKVLAHLGIDWPRDPISPMDRVMIMRGLSKYRHTSIDGGLACPDTTKRIITLEPSSIDDDVLRGVTSDLISRRRKYWANRIAVRQGIRGASNFHGSESVWLDELRMDSAQVGYGEVGFRGKLGYEDGWVTIHDELFDHSISTHGTSQVAYTLPESAIEFRSRVAINDTAIGQQCSADFIVVADGTIVGIAIDVQPGDSPYLLTADLRNATKLELITIARRWDFCHSVWLDPLVLVGGAGTLSVSDCLQRAKIAVPDGIPKAKLCIATVGDVNYCDWVDDLLHSIQTRGNCPDALLAVFSINDSEELRNIADRYNAVVIPCFPAHSLSPNCKSIMYAAGHVLPAERFICLDADMLVLGDLSCLVPLIDSTSPNSILACREATWASDLKDAISIIYHGEISEVRDFLTSRSEELLSYPFVINDGLFAGSRVALCAADNFIRSLEGAKQWMDDPEANIPWRNQFVFNLALARGGCGVELARRFNVQLLSERGVIKEEPDHAYAEFNGQRAVVVHFNGGSGVKYPDWRNRLRPKK